MNSMNRTLNMIIKEMIIKNIVLFSDIFFFILICLVAFPNTIQHLTLVILRTVNSIRISNYNDKYFDSFYQLFISFRFTFYDHHFHAKQTRETKNSFFFVFFLCSDIFQRNNLHLLFHIFFSILTMQLLFFQFCHRHRHHNRPVKDIKQCVGLCDNNCFQCNRKLVYSLSFCV